ncbi:MAG TPA: hypothetical protein VNO21_22080, partial [Polyangiaceae bacterium]|nr:hypothetical protein [Polyangiaceae bacterium]
MSTRDLHDIQRAALAAERRIRFGRALGAGATSLAIALLVAAAALTLRKTAVIGEWTARVVLSLAMLQVVAVAVVTYVRPLALRAGAVALDRHHGLADRLSSALSFGDLSDAERTPFMDAAIADALTFAGKVEPKKAVPLQLPRDGPLAAGLGVAVLALALFEVRHHEPAMQSKTIDAVEVTADDLDAMREFLHQLEQQDQSEQTKAATAEFNQLIEDL